jgi:hypothetical protein
MYFNEIYNMDKFPLKCEIYLISHVTGLVLYLCVCGWVSGLAKVSITMKTWYVPLKVKFLEVKYSNIKPKKMPQSI